MLSIEEKEKRRKDRSMKKYNESHKEVDGVLLKQCSICKEWFPCIEESFYKNKSNSLDGLNTYCKKCTKAKYDKWRLDPKNKESLARNIAKDNAKPECKLRNRKHGEKRRLNGKYKKWQDENKDKLSKYGRDRGQNKTHTFSKEEWVSCQGYFNNECAYCGLSIEEHFTTYRGITKQGNFHKEHVNHLGSNDLNNCVPACKECNCEKHTHPLEEWYNDNNTKFKQERLDKIHKWINEDYKIYEIPYKIKKTKNVDNDKSHYELWSRDTEEKDGILLATENNKKSLSKYIKEYFENKQ